ncbi:MAG: AmmeMemoRadiSam system protein A, partial [Hyphomicrobium sp.]
GYGAFGFEYAASARLSDPDRHFLLKTAMAALSEAALKGGNAGNLIAQGPLSPVLTAHRATFVTLTHENKLRGCVGSVIPHRPLTGDIFLNTVKAGFQDRRFSPLSPEELNGLTVSISILSHRREIQMQKEQELLETLEPDRDGLILQDGEKSALFLPSVWSSLPDPLHFVRHLKAKAQLSADH